MDEIEWDDCAIASWFWWDGSWT